jgi:Taurine catabolism dioxygenase TauD, TfdA family
MTTVRKDVAPYVVYLPTNRDKDLGSFLEHNSAAVWEGLAKSGAVLFRNFSVSSERTFEDALLSLQELRPMDCYFMSEHGRSRVEGASRFVLYTNKFRKTGGTWFIDGIHTENYYTCDVPHFIAFWCKTPSWFGGEAVVMSENRASVDFQNSPGEVVTFDDEAQR